MGLREKLASMPPNRRRKYLIHKLKRLQEMRDNLDRRNSIIDTYMAELIAERNKQP